MAAYPQANLEEEIQSSYHRFHLSEDAPVVQLATKAAEKLGLPVKYEIGGGGSDANVFNEKGIPAVICANLRRPTLVSGWPNPSTMPCGRRRE